MQKAFLSQSFRTTCFQFGLVFKWENGSVGLILKVKVKVVQSFLTLWDPMDCQAPLCMEFSRQEYWSGQPFPSLGDLPDPGIKLRSPALQADSMPSEPPVKLIKSSYNLIKDKLYLFFLQLKKIDKDYEDGSLKGNINNS